MSAAIREWETEFVEVGDRAYAYIQAGGGFCVANAGLIATEQGPIAIDALFTPAMTRAFLGAVQRAGKGDVRLLVNTHHHVDHTLGNALFAAPILAHRFIREEMQRVGLPRERLIMAAPHFKAELDQVRGVRLPTATFSGDMSIYDGDREIRLLHVGTAHTTGDTVIYLPESRLLYAGDVAFHYVTPLAFEGHVGNWIAVLDRIAEMDVERIVPGHGPVGGSPIFARCGTTSRCSDKRRSGRTTPASTANRRRAISTRSSVASATGPRPSASSPTSCACTRSLTARSPSRWTWNGPSAAWRSSRARSPVPGELH